MINPVLLAAASVFTAFYTGLGVAALRRLRKPTCRVCLYRGFCPSRDTEISKPNSQPCWRCGQASACAETAPYSEV
jgi:hypothetical protein